ncbi:DNA-directed DNA polymerase alpha subunit pol12 [Lecanora helva]
MADVKSELNELFAIPPVNELPPDILGELQSILRLHSITPQELSYKWESYCMKMGSEQTKLDLTTARAFKKDLQEMLERESRGKAHARSVDKRGAFATPRSSGKGDDVFGMLDGIVPNTPVPQRPKNGSVKRKSAFETPAVPKFSKADGMSSPSDARANGNTNTVQAVPFSERQNAGQIMETLNDHLSPCEAPLAPPSEARVRLTANTDLKKFSYKPMAMHLSEASEVLDDRIDEFQSLVQAHHGLDDAAFGSAANRATSEIIAVGRIASEALEGKLNASSLMLETSRRTGAGLRIPLRIESLSYEFFPGQIVAVRGINASGLYFSVNEVLELPLLAPAVSSLSTLEAHNTRLGVEDGAESATQAMNVMISSGPYTADDNLDFEPLRVLCERAAESYTDVLIMVGPIFDLEHPLVATGDFDLPDDPSIEPDKATLSDAFRILVGKPLSQLALQVPNITIILVPSVRDVINKHVSWPQEPFEKKPLGLPKKARVVTNPVTISLNEVVIGISAQDVLYDLRREEVLVGRPKEPSLLSRLPRHVIQQRHFYPIFPPADRNTLPKTGTTEGVATGMPLDTAYLKLGEWLNVRPDMLITPSALSPFAKVVDSVLVVNPGPLSKRKGPGTYAQLAIHPWKLADGEHESANNEGLVAPHRLFDRARADIIRI